MAWFTSVLGREVTAAGVAYDAATAWDEHRVHAVYSWLSAATTAGMGSQWQPVHIGMAAAGRTSAACAHPDSIAILEQRLALT